MAGIIASTVANHAFGGRKTTAVPSDYMPSARIKGRATQPVIMTAQQQVQNLRTTFRGLAAARPVQRETKDAE